VINHIQSSCGIEQIGSPTIIYEDNVACVAQIQSGYVKLMLLNMLFLNFSTHTKLQVSGKISILQIKSVQ
jgi:hypothetical protein